MKVTRLEWPLPEFDTWSGNATGDDGKPYCFYYQPRKRFSVMKQDAKTPTAWFLCRPSERHESSRPEGDQVAAAEA
jgi:hypothetical protein